MSWVLLVVLGATLNVLSNYGYKIALQSVGLAWFSFAVLVASTIVIGSTTLIKKRSGWQVTLKTNEFVVLSLIAAGLFGVFLFFSLALKAGPISLVDPLWACIYSLSSLIIGLFIAHERSKILAIFGIGLYVGGAALMGLSHYAGPAEMMNTSNQWPLYVLIGAILNTLVNYGFRVKSRQIDMSITLTMVWLLSSIFLFIYAFISDPNGYKALFDTKIIAIALCMGCAAPVFMIMMIKALLRGPYYIVDPLWACIYSIGSIFIGISMLVETPSLYALLGVGLYILGAVLMAQHPQYFESGKSMPHHEKKE